jgi:dipeptidyl aminopeptidase/acylaminoacyl peptidase
VGSFPVPDVLRKDASERLRGQWGIADVNDSVRAVLLLSDLVDTKRALIRGGSAGGYTVLQALTTPSTANVFAGGTSSYGISDLEALMHDTHKFESQYLFKLLSAKKDVKERDEELNGVYVERSPVKNAKNIKAPVLVS